MSSALAAGFLKWLTSKQPSTQKTDILINNTSTPLFISGLAKPIAPNGTFPLPKRGTITIKLDKNQDPVKDLKIELDKYINKRNTAYLNLTISKKWFSPLFTVPLTKSDAWVDKEK